MEPKMLLRGKSKERPSPRKDRKVTPPGPAYMTSEQFAAYLASIRDSRNSRPAGSRLPPASTSSPTLLKNSTPPRRETSGRISSPSRPSLRGSVHSESAAARLRPRPSSTTPQNVRPSLRPGVSVAGSVGSRHSTMITGRDYYPVKPATPLTPGEVVPSATYMERGSRWMEKEEAFSLRTAMEDMNLKEQGLSTPEDEEEKRLYNAALDEAAELVWRHEHGVEPPEPGAPYRYKPHMRPNSYAHARTASIGRYGNDIGPTGLARNTSHSGSGSSAGSDGRSSVEYSSRRSVDRKMSPDSARKPYGKTSSDATTRTVSPGRRSGTKRISGEAQSPFSAEQIWEEPGSDRSKDRPDSPHSKSSVVPSALRLNPKTSPNRVQFAPDPEASATDKTSPVSRIEIHRNAPSQSRNPNYTVNSKKPMGPRANDESPKKNGVEIRSDDIRQATSFKLGDRSRKLPTPAAVSDSPGRPIVSFDNSWKAPEEKATDSKPEPPKPGRFAVGRRPESPQKAQEEEEPQPSQSAPQRPSIPTVSSAPGPQVSSPAQAQAQAQAQPPASIPTSINANMPVDLPIHGRPSLSSAAVSPDNNQLPVKSSVLMEEDKATATAAGSPAGAKPAGRPLPTPARKSPFARSGRGGSVSSIVPPGPNKKDDGSSVPVIATPTRDDSSNGATKFSPRPLPTPSRPSPFARNGRGASVPSVVLAADDGKKSGPSIPTIVTPGDANAETPPRPGVPTIVTPDDDDSSKPSRSRSIPNIVTPDDESSNPSRTRGLPTIVTPDDGTPKSSPAPGIPTIVMPDDDGSKASPGRGIPTIVMPEDGSSKTSPSPSARPLPTPSKSSPFSRHARGGSRSHWSPDPGAVSSRATAICHECSFPIEGRFVALKGSLERFHPQCFACFTCGTSLEALEISPEPDSFRSERLDRIARRAAGEVLEEAPGKTMAEDGDTRLRFYCHLDWHELYAPRCKHCTTPILGDHVVALGHHFHFGHFFCAECGDPFEQGMTHIEKDGYAWCINCQTKRTERRAPKCKRCKTAVIGQYVRALGGEWHDQCFRCATCEGGFDDGQIFPVGDRVLCTGCRMRELKA